MYTHTYKKRTHRNLIEKQMNEQIKQCRYIFMCWSALVIHESQVLSAQVNSDLASVSAQSPALPHLVLKTSLFCFSPGNIIASIYGSWVQSKQNICFASSALGNYY